MCVWWENACVVVWLHVFSVIGSTVEVQAAKEKGNLYFFSQISRLAVTVFIPAHMASRGESSQVVDKLHGGEEECSKGRDERRK